MSSTRRACLLLCAVAVGAAVVAAIPPGGHAQRSSPCAFAEALEERNLRDRAINEYVELLRANPALRCALTGLARLTVRAQCAFPKALVRAKLRNRAINAYVRILRVRPGSKCAREGLARLATRRKPPSPPAPSPCAVAQGLRDAGRLTEAEAAYVKVREASPTEPCALEGLKAIREDRCALAAHLADEGDKDGAEAIYSDLLKQEPTLPCARAGVEESWPERAERFTNDVASIAGALALLAAVSLAFLFLIGRPTRVADFLHRRAVVGNFFAPRIAIGEFKAGKDLDVDSFAAHLRRGLHRLASTDPGGLGLNAVSTSQGLGPAISSLGDASPHFKAAGALVSLMAQVRPRRRFLLAGTVGAGAARVDATLEEKGSPKAMTALGAAKPPVTGDSAEDLALVLAAWAYFEVRRLARDRRSPYTDNVASSAFLDAGLVVEAGGDDVGAARMYRTALAIDDRNVDAWVALGNLECKTTVTPQGVAKLRWALLLAEGLA